MTEHVHEWNIIFDIVNECKVVCYCQEEISQTEAEARLNATERLSVKNARYFAKETRMIALRHYLNGYADILEGKDG